MSTIISLENYTVDLSVNFLRIVSLFPTQRDCHNVTNHRTLSEVLLLFTCYKASVVTFLRLKLYQNWKAYFYSTSHILFCKESQTLPLKSHKAAEGYLWNSVHTSRHWRLHCLHIFFYFPTNSNYNMAVVQTSEVRTTLTPLNYVAKICRILTKTSII